MIKLNSKKELSLIDKIAYVIFCIPAGAAIIWGIKFVIKIFNFNFNKIYIKYIIYLIYLYFFYKIIY